MAGQLPIEVEEFIVNHIDSVEQLEVLLLLSSAPGRSWSPEAVNEKIKSSVESVTTRLEKLTSQGLLIRNPPSELSFRYEPATPQLAGAVAAMAAAYKEKRVKVLECIFAKPLSTLRIFADSFKIRKDPKNG